MKLNPFIAKTTLQTGMMNAVVSKFCILHLQKQDFKQFCIFSAEVGHYPNKSAKWHYGRHILI